MDYQAAKDEDLMLAYKEGDRRAFEALLSRHKQSVYNYLYRFLHKPEIVDEAFQEVFLRVLKYASTYTPTAKFTTWLFTIIRNFCIDLSRRGKFRNMKSLDQPAMDEEGATLGDKLADERPGPAEIIAGQTLAEKLQRALDVINPDQKEVFLLRETQGLAFEEIASVVDVSVNTVKSRMRYALTALQEELKKMGITDR